MIWLDNTRILATFAVILLHVSAYFVSNYSVGTEYWWVGNIYDSSVRWSVPVFVMISGVLLLNPNKQESLSVFYKKRAFKLLIPTIFWSIFFPMWSLVRNATSSDIFIGSTELLEKVIAETPYFHMWFIYMIFGLYLLTPFLKKIVIHSSKKELLFLIVISLSMSALNTINSSLSPEVPILFINVSFYFLPYFLLGYFIHLNKKPPSFFLLWGVFLLSLTLTAAGFFTASLPLSPISGFYFYGYTSITVIPMSISLMYLLKSWSTPLLNEVITKKLSSYTLGIYLIHPVLLEIISDKKYDIISFHPVISIPLITLIIFTLSLGLVWVIHKIPYLKRVI
jgi:surface polysaccharide O-acyltransferase-like enzyme